MGDKDDNNKDEVPLEKRPTKSNLEENSKFHALEGLVSEGEESDGSLKDDDVAMNDQDASLVTPHTSPIHPSGTQRNSPLGNRYGRRGGYASGPSRMPIQKAQLRSGNASPTRRMNDKGFISGDPGSHSRKGYVGPSAGSGPHSKPPDLSDAMDCLESMVPSSIDANVTQDVMMKDAAKRPQGS